MDTTIPHAPPARDVAEEWRPALPGDGEAQHTLQSWDTTGDDQAYVVLTTPRTSYVIRRVTSTDTALLVDLLTRLSERTRRLRYMAPRPLSHELAWAEAARMAHRQTSDHLTLIALRDGDDHHEVIAAAELMRTERAPRMAELAVVVRDDHQGQGIGRALVEQLVERARSRGIDAVHADLLAENRPMLRLLGGLALPQSTTTRYGETEVIMRIPARANDPTRSADAETAGSAPD